MLNELDVPVVVAPMAGGPTTLDLVAAVTGAGGFGFLSGGGLDVAGTQAAISAVRGLTDRPFGVNLFLPDERRDDGVAQYRDRLAAAGLPAGEPGWTDDAYPAKLAALLADPVPVVSFTFGCPDASTVDRLHAVGSQAVATVTTPATARRAVGVGVDALVVQGMEAGAHRGVRAAGDSTVTNLWAGQGYPLGRALPAAELVAALLAGARAATAAVSGRLGVGASG